MSRPWLERVQQVEDRAAHAGARGREHEHRSLRVQPGDPSRLVHAAARRALRDDDGGLPGLGVVHRVERPQQVVTPPDRVRDDGGQRARESRFGADARYSRLMSGDRRSSSATPSSGSGDGSSGGGGRSGSAARPAAAALTSSACSQARRASSSRMATRQGAVTAHEQVTRLRAQHPGDEAARGGLGRAERVLEPHARRAAVRAAPVVGVPRVVDERDEVRLAVRVGLVAAENAAWPSSMTVSLSGTLSRSA